MKIIFFDGYCNLCNGFVDWLIRMDRAKIFKFASLQGETAKGLLSQSTPSVEVETVVFLMDGVRLERSTAVLNIFICLGGPWKLARILLFIPPVIRDGIYRVIAKYRFLIFGKRNTCRLPTAEEKDQLLS